MAFGSKTGGRKPGTPNKKNQEIVEMLKEKKADPALFLAKVMKGDRRELGYEDRIEMLKRQHAKDKNEFDRKNAKLIEAGKEEPYPDFVPPPESELMDMNLFPIDIRQTAAKELMPYVYGKRKPVDSNGDDSSDPLTSLVEALRDRN